MKTKVYLLALAVFAATCTFAQNSSDKDAKKEATSLSIGVDGGLPIGDFNKGYNFGIGGSAKVGIPIFDGGAVTISAGYISFMGKTETVSGVSVKNDALGTIPFKAGLRFRIAEGFYGEPQLGATMVSMKVPNTTGTGTKSENKTYFTYAAGVGYMINNMIDIGARYEAFSQKVTEYDINTTTGAITTKSVNKSTGFIGFRVAYKFSF